MERVYEKEKKENRRKRKVPVVDAESQTEYDISDVDEEDSRARNQKLWKYFFDDNNFKYSTILINYDLPDCW